MNNRCTGSAAVSDVVKRGTGHPDGRWDWQVFNCIAAEYYVLRCRLDPLRLWQPRHPSEEADAHPMAPWAEEAAMPLGAAGPMSPTAGLSAAFSKGVHCHVHAMLLH